MRAFGHISIALLLAKLLNWYVGIGELLFVTMMSLLPDIDHPNSILGRIKPISFFIYKKFGHRSFTHSLIFAILITNFFAINLKFYKLAWLAIGSHLFADMLTYTGVPLFWPYRKNFVVFGGPLITGSWKETLISIMSILLVVVLCI